MHPHNATWLVVVSLALSACNGQPGDPASNPIGNVAQAQNKPAAAAPAAQSATPAGKLVAGYLAAQEALVADDLAAARAGFGLVKANALTQAIADAALLARVSKAATAGAAAKDLEGARNALHDLSTALLDWLRAQPNPAGEALRVANCPMAFGSGAKWLQRAEKVRNPYYGTEMPTCGSIDATVKPGEKLSK